MYWLVALSSVFMFQIKKIYISNIFFVLWIIIRSYTVRKSYRYESKNLYIYLFYLGWIAFSMLIFVLQYGYFEARNFVQFIYNIQYVFFIVEGTLDKRKIRHAMYVSSYILAVVIIGLWIVKTGMQSMPVLLVENRMWAENYIVGWPNTTVLPLLFGVFEESKNIKHHATLFGILRLGLLMCAVVLCTSRSGYLGVALILGYFLFANKEETKKWQIMIKYMLSICCLICLIIYLWSYITANGMAGRMFMVADRQGIFLDVIEYFSDRPISGYGGNTIDVIYKVVRPTKTGMNWGHTHNTVLELLIRHGMIGALAFAVLVYCLSKRIIAKEDRAMYWILWGLSLFQIYYKDFVFLLLVYMLMPSETYQVAEISNQQYFLRKKKAGIR